MKKTLKMNVVVSLLNEVEKIKSNQLKQIKNATSENSEQHDYFTRLSEQVKLLKLAKDKGNSKHRKLLGIIPIGKTIGYYIYTRSEIKAYKDAIQVSSLSTNKKSIKIKEQTDLITEIDKKLELLNSNINVVVELDSTLNLLKLVA